jgi:hypothetical protein
MNICPTMRRGAGSHLRHLRQLRLSALVCVMLAGAACRDGYPTVDEPLKNPSEMALEELLAEMNQTGEQPHLGQQWRYRLQAGCVLEVTVRRGPGKGEKIAVPLEEATIEVLVDDADKSFDVHVRPKDRAGKASVAVLEGGKWTDSIGMRSLLQYLQRRCSETEHPARDVEGARHAGLAVATLPRSWCPG